MQKWMLAILNWILKVLQNTVRWLYETLRDFVKEIMIFAFGIFILGVIGLILLFFAEITGISRTFDNSTNHEAAEAGKIERISDLLDEGKNIEAKDKHGNTPLHRATWNGQPEAVITLLDRGADATAKNNENKQPIDIADSESLSEIAYKRLQAASK